MHRFQKIAIGTVACAVVAAVIFVATTKISKAGGLSGVQWNQIGPSPLAIDADQNTQGTGPDSGKVDDIAIDPRGSSDQIIYIATDNGGLWKSADGGTTWAPMTDSLGSLSGGAVALDFGNLRSSTTAPAITSPPRAVLSTAQSVFTYRLTREPAGRWPRGSTTLAGKNIIRMVSPAANVLVVATNSGLFRSTDGGNSFTNIIPPGATASSYITDLKLDTTAAGYSGGLRSGNFHIQRRRRYLRSEPLDDLKQLAYRAPE